MLVGGCGSVLTLLARTSASKDHLGLALVGCIPDNIIAERMVFQQLTCIPEQMWLYEYGRFSSYLMVSDNLAKVRLARSNDDGMPRPLVQRCLRRLNT